ncbi:helix-turn-helix domain-containing protein [Streptomyces sp. NPDC058861]|uniref:helix-turn-helix domain-containing protein n=1 Tax=Streptomyces sp. NPDC058861 TaxID=3346653 RepID=UPI0036C7D20E
MAAPIGPTVRRMQLGKQLTQVRKQAGFSTPKAAVEGLEISEAQYRRVEGGQSAFRRASDLVTVLEHFGVTDKDDIEHFISLHRDGQNRGWWSSYARTMSSGMKIYVGLEDGAKAIRAWQPNVVHGLLQTEKYAEALFATHKPVDEMTTEEVIRGVEVRMERREILTRDNPVEFRVVLDEAALRREVGSREVMREQHEELIALSERSNVFIHVIPLSKATYRCPSDFAVLDFDDGLPTIVQMDMPDGEVRMTDKADQIRTYSRRFDALRDGALSTGETSKFLHQLAREI